MWFSYPNMEDWIPLKVDRVKEIMAMNKKGLKPNNLKEEAVELVSTTVIEKTPDYENVVGQDSLTRLDDKPKNKGNRNNNNKPGGNRSGEPRNNNNANRTERPAKSGQQGRTRTEGNKNPAGGPPAVKTQPKAQPLSTDVQPKAANPAAAAPADGTAPKPSRNNRNRNNNRRKKPTDKPKNE
jgi:hypothetical protein